MNSTPISYSFAIIILFVAESHVNLSRRRAKNHETLIQSHNIPSWEYVCLALVFIVSNISRSLSPTLIHNNLSHMPYLVPQQSTTKMCFTVGTIHVKMITQTIGYQHSNEEAIHLDDCDGRTAYPHHNMIK